MQNPKPAPKSRIRPFASARDHKWIAVITILLAISASGIYYLLKEPTYQSTAILEVSPKYITNLDEGNELQIRFYDDFVNNQVFTLRSYDNIEKALEILQQNDIKDRQAQIKGLQDALMIEHVRHTYRIIVGLAGSKPDGLAETVNAVIDSYIEKINEEKIPEKDTRRGNLIKRKMEIASELQSLFTRRIELIEKSGIMISDDNSENVYGRAYLDAYNAQLEAEKSYREAKYRVEGLKITDEDFESQLELGVEEELNQNPYLAALSDALNEKKINLLSNIAGTSENHPGRKSTLKAIEEIEREFETQRKDIAYEIRERQRKKLKLGIEKEQRNLQLDLKTAELRKIETNNIFKKQKESSDTNAKLHTQQIEIARKIESKRKNVEQIEDKLNFFVTEENSPGFVSISSRARVPETPLKGKKVKVMLLIVAAGFVFAILIPTLIDYMNPWVKTPTEIESILRFPSLGWIIETSDKSTKSFSVDQIRRLAISISKQFNGHDKRFFMVTSVKPGGGTTTVTLNLAQHLKQIGINALAVECNAFKNDEKYQNGKSSLQLSDIISKTSKINQPEFLEQLSKTDRVAVGDTNNKRHLNFGKNFLNKLKRSNHDVYLLDCPPLLLSSDTEYLARICDATLLIVEAEGVMIGEIKRASYALEKIKPPLVGFIANRIRIKKGTGYFNKMLKEYESGTKVR